MSGIKLSNQLKIHVKGILSKKGKKNNTSIILNIKLILFLKKAFQIQSLLINKETITLHYN